ncbi:DUF4258 domain-containing protein [Microbacterium sp. Se5.02b]|uniref:DUF4258 domain-containing protein n=1 Tax=Microbacterium sp. Se5.02b TaxID=2864103 RepID=UPI001C68E8BF|nr:DUF4258 domain-containing protein [Microbacterium sp. Se5.02b]QYM64521.1 DUF4258 domain-containing protein [Microbacterium sp. Se5.02b]
MIERIEPSVLDNLVKQSHEMTDGHLVTEQADVRFALDSSAPKGISMTTMDGIIEIGLPGARVAPEAELHPGGAVIYDNVDGTTTVATVRQSGSVQVTTVIDDATAPTEYAYPITLPEAAELSRHEDGSVSVLDGEGELIAIVDVPWAKDATGATVPTDFVVKGNTLTQIVHHHGAVYPVIADPWWIPALFVMARLSAHAAKQIAARGISQNLVRIALQEGKRTRGNEKGTSVFTANNIRVIVNDKTGNIITVTRAGGGGASGGR